MKWIAPTIRILGWGSLVALGATNIAGLSLGLGAVGEKLGGFGANVLVDFVSGTLQRLLKIKPVGLGDIEFRAFHETVFEAAHYGEENGSIPRALELSEQIKRSAASSKSLWAENIRELLATDDATALLGGRTEPNQSDIEQLIERLYPFVKGTILTTLASAALSGFERKFIQLLSRDDSQQLYRQHLLTSVLSMHREMMAKLDEIHVEVKEGRSEIGEIRELIVEKVSIDVNAPANKQEAVRLYNDAIDIIQGRATGDAIDLLSKSLQLDHSFFDAFFARAVAFMNLKDYISSLSDLDRALTIRSGDAVALWARSTVREFRKDGPGAVEDARQAVSRDPLNEKYHVRLGYALSFCERAQEAQEAFSKALELAPNSADARHGLAIVIDDKDRMLKLLQEAVELKPAWGRAHQDLGLVYLKFDRIEDAQKEFQRAVELDPSLGQAWTQIASHAAKTQGREVAEELFKKAIEADPELFHGYGSLGAMRFEHEDYHGAIEMFDQAIQRQSHPAVYSLRGLSKEKIGDDQGAIDDYSVEIHLKPDDGDAYYNRGKVYRRHNMFADALKDLDKAIELSPDHFEAHIERARCRIGTREFEGAMADCEKAIELQPDHFEGYFRRARVYDEMGDLARAEAEYRNLLKKWPDASFYNNLGMLLIRQGKNGESIEFLDKAVEEGMGPIALVNRAIALVETGQSQKAAEDVRQAIAENPAWQSQLQVDPAYAPLMRDPTTRAAIG